MKIKELKELLGTLSNEVVDIDIEDYDGNTMLKLSDLDLADIENTYVRLQSNKKRKE